MKAALALVGLISLCAWAEPSSEMSAAGVAAEIRTSGPQSVLLKYYDTLAWTSSIIPGIKSAAPDWLGVAEQLRPVSDAGASEDIGLALYGALAVAPFRVIPILSRIYGGTVEQLCNVSFEAEVPPQGAGSYLQRIRSKLRAARTEREHKMAAACSRGLELSLAEATARGLK